MGNRRRSHRQLRRCAATGLVMFKSELEAKIVLASRVWRDKGEKRVFPCPAGNHFHLTSMEEPSTDGLRSAASN